MSALPPKSGHWLRVSGCPLRAKRRRSAPRRERRHFDHLSAAAGSSCRLELELLAIGRSTPHGEKTVATAISKIIRYATYCKISGRVMVTPMRVGEKNIVDGIRAQ